MMASLRDLFRFLPCSTWTPSSTVSSSTLLIMDKPISSIQSQIFTCIVETEEELPLSEYLCSDILISCKQLSPLKSEHKEVLCKLKKMKNKDKTCTFSICSTVLRLLQIEKKVKILPNTFSICSTVLRAQSTSVPRSTQLTCRLKVIFDPKITHRVFFLCFFLEKMPYNFQDKVGGRGSTVLTQHQFGKK